MEENEVIKEKNNNHYLRGTMGAIIGGLIASIPWIFVYIEFSMIMTLLAILIGMGALKGYQIFKGKITKKTKAIIIIISLAIIGIETLVVIPNIYAYKYGYNLESFYSQIQSALIRDTLISLLFGLFGASWAITTINKILVQENVVKDEKLEEVVNAEEKLRQAQINNSLSKDKKVEIEILRKVFGKLNAVSKQNAIEKQAILDEFEKENVVNAEKMFKKYQRLDLIKKYKGKFYYNSKAEVQATRGYWIWFIIFIAVMVIANISNDNSTNNYDNNTIDNSSIEQITPSLYTIKDSNITVNKHSEMILIEEYEEAGYAPFETIDANSMLDIYATDKQIYAIDYTLDEYKKAVKDHISTVYVPQGDIIEEEFEPLFDYNAVKMSYNSVYDIYNVKVNIYVIETENYIVEGYGISIINHAEEDEKILDEMMKTIKEIENETGE